MITSLLLDKIFIYTFLNIYQDDINKNKKYMVKQPNNQNPVNNAGGGGAGEGGGGGAANAIASNNGFASVDDELDSITANVATATSRTQGYTAGRTIVADAGGLLSDGTKVEANLISVDANSNVIINDLGTIQRSITDANNIVTQTEYTTYQGCAKLAGGPAANNRQTLTGYNSVQQSLVLNNDLQLADNVGGGNANCHILDQDGNKRIQINNTGVGFLNSSSPQVVAAKYQTLNSTFYVEDSRFQCTNTNGGSPLQLFSIDGNSLVGEIKLSPTGSSLNGISLIGTAGAEQVILRDNVLVSSGKDITVDGSGVQGGLGFSVSQLNAAPIWSPFDILGAGNSTIFTRSSPAADSDPTHVASALLPGGGTNANQQTDDNLCEATRQVRVDALGDLIYFVTLRGRLIKTGGAASSYVLFTLPAGYRPNRKRHFSCQQDFGNNVSHFNINNSGECRVSGGSVMSLDGISFWTN